MDPTPLQEHCQSHHVRRACEVDGITQQLLQNIASHSYLTGLLP